jgi:hypothetical protein
MYRPYNLSGIMASTLMFEDPRSLTLMTLGPLNPPVTMIAAGRFRFPETLVWTLGLLVRLSARPAPPAVACRNHRLGYMDNPS